MSEDKCTSGRLIALEGDTQGIATQLRLLPSSQKILIIPSLEEQLSEEKETNFDARSFVRDVHTAFEERTKSARSFLQNSTSAHPKLVFMNGGCVSARETCIARILENLTDGEIGAAEAIFNDIVKDGVAGLMREDIKTDEDEKTMAQVEREEVPMELPEDPSLTAMRRAESLDQETAGLQSEYGHVGHEVPVKEHMKGTTGVSEEKASSPSSRPRRKSQAPTFNGNIFKSLHNKDGEIITTVLTIPTRNASLQKTCLQQDMRATMDPKYSPSQYTHSEYSFPLSAVSPRTIRTTRPMYVEDGPERENGSSGSPGYEIGEAQVIEVHSATRENFLRRAKSFDGSRGEEHSARAKALKHTTSHEELRKRSVVLEAFKNANFVGLPSLQRGAFMRASQTTIGRSPGLKPGSKDSRRTYVERATDAEEYLSGQLAAEPFVPVFDLVEDLVIHFTARGLHDELFESVLRSYKNGTCPIWPATEVEPSIKEEKYDDPMSPESMMTASLEVTSGLESNPEAGKDDVRPTVESRDSFDPYATHNYPKGIRRQTPPTPLMTPPPTSKTSEKFLTFIPLNPNNAISVQNSFRQLLQSHFPAGPGGYSQHYYPMSPEADRLWKPVFRNNDSSNFDIEGRNMDAIIALGCEANVDSEFSTKVSGLVEKLGTKRNGVNKNGKLDIRYLITNVIQNYPILPGVTNAVYNPLTNPHLLATLLVPQLESYLANNSCTRLLILQYTSYHLPTVFALRKLLGSDTLKIAGVLDSMASDLPNSSGPRTPASPSANPLFNDAVASRKQFRHVSPTKRSESGEIPIILSSPTSQYSQPTNPSIRSPITTKAPPLVSFARADFLLPSPATDAEVTTFLSGIWKCLMDKSSFYTPEPEPAPRVQLVEKIVERPVLPEPKTPGIPEKNPGRISPERRSRDPRERERQQIAQRRENKMAKLTGSAVAAHSREPSLMSYKKNYAASIGSFKTTASEKERKEWENFYIGEDDSEDDEYDRMILGRAGIQKFVPEEEDGSEIDEKEISNSDSPVDPRRRQTVGSRADAQERNTVSKRKALKWLGLA